MRLLILLIVLAFIMTPLVEAFGVTPGRQTFEYRESISGRFTVVNNAGVDLELTVVPRGSLAEHVKLERSIVRMDADEEQQAVSYTINLPANLEPGDHKVEFYILSFQSSSIGESNVGAATGVVSQAIINVPYPGKYVRARLDYDAVSRTVHVPVFGLGREAIDDLSADLVVYGPTNNVVASVRSPTKQLPVGGVEEFSFVLDLEPGTYLSRATVSFAGRTNVVEKTISVGRAQVIVQDITVPDYQFGSISKLVLHAKSEWNEPIDTAATVEFYDDGVLIERVRSAQTLIEPFARADFDIYWDSAGYDPGEYRVIAKLTVGEETVERSFPVVLTPSSIQVGGVSGNVVAGGSNASIIVIAVVILIILNAILLFVLFKRKK